MASFLKEFFALLNRDYDYAVLRNFESLPDDNASRDIDILILCAELRRLRKALPEFAEAHRSRILYTNEDNQFFTIVFCDSENQVFQFDFQHNFAWMGIDLLDEREILSHRISNGRVWHLPPDLTFLPKYLYCRILGGVYPAKYAEVRRAALEYDGPGIEARLHKIADGGIDYWDRSGKWKLRVKAFASALFHRPWRAMARMTEFCWRYFIDLFRRRGLMISFTGPDGSGKTTVIELLRERLAVNPPKLFHFRPNLLPNLGEVGAKTGIKKDVDRNFDKPHRGKKHGILSSFIRLHYYCLDYRWGYVFKILPLRQRKSIVFFDRYFTDIIVDHERSGIHLSHKLIAWVRHFIPGCQYNFFFRVDPDTILARKQELNREAIDRIYGRMEYLATRDKRCHWIDNNGAPEDAVRQILTILAEHQHAKYVKKL